MITQAADDVYVIPIDLPKSPLKLLNAYFVRNRDGRELLVDTGFNTPRCLAALTEGLRELEADYSRLDVFITHMHADHSGNAAALQGMGCRLIMGETDHDILELRSRDVKGLRAASEGMADGDITETLLNNSAIRHVSAHFDAEPARPGDSLHYGRYSLKCVPTPGHTPGHMCLYDEERSFAFLGDHVLFDITPNISYWPGVDDPLNDYLDSLEAVKKLDIGTALPAHRGRGDKTANERIDELIAHHHSRLDELETLIRREGGLTAYELAGRLSWHIRAKDWASFPPAQKWFAFGETVAHLDYLRIRGRIYREPSGQRFVYLAD